MNIKSLGQKGTLVGMMVLSMAAGAAGGTTLFNALAVHAQTAPMVVTAQTAATPTMAPNSMDQGTPGGKFKSNEDPTHEKGESAAREVQEDAGQRPTVK